MLYKQICVRGVWLGLVAMIFAPTGVTAGESVELKAKFPSGRVSYIEMSSDAQQSIKGPMFPSGEMKIDIRQTMGVIEKVEPSSSGGVKVIMTFDRRAGFWNVPMMGELQYDSDAPSEDDAPYLKQLFAPTLGMTMTMGLDKDNQIVSFSGMKAMLKKVQAAAQGNPFMRQVGSNLTNDVAKETWGNSRLIILPNKKIEVGESWDYKHVQDQPEIGKMIIEIKCKLDRISVTDGRKAAIITYSGKISSDPNEKPKASPTGMNPTLIDGSIKGTATFDVRSSQIVKQVEETQMNMSMSPPGAQGESVKMQVATKSLSTTTVKSLAEREKEKKENKKKAQAKKEDAKKAEGNSGSERP